MELLVTSGNHQPINHLWTVQLLRWGIDRIRDHAIAGDEKAMSAYGSLIRDLVDDLESCLRIHPKVVRNWSRKRSDVPVLAGKNEARKTALAKILDEFQVGEDAPIRVNPPQKKKGINLSIRVNSIAAGLCAHIERYRALGPMLEEDSELARTIAQLPPLSKATWEAWADVGWIFILQTTKGSPEAHPALGPLGKSAGDKPGLGGAKTIASNTKAKIKYRLREAIRRMAPP